MLDIGFQELLVVMVIALLVFGPYKLPELGRALGRAMREFRRASDEFRSTIETNLNINEDTILPPSASLPPAAPAVGEAAADAGSPVSLEAAQGGGADAATDGARVEPAGWPAPDVPGEASALPLEPFCAQRGGRLLHRTTCDWVGRIREADRVAYKAFAEAAEVGLVPCPACEPRQEPGEPAVAP